MVWQPPIITGNLQTHRCIPAEQGDFFVVFFLRKAFVVQSAQFQRWPSFTMSVKLADLQDRSIVFLWYRYCHTAAPLKTTFDGVRIFSFTHFLFDILPYEICRRVLSFRLFIVHMRTVACVDISFFFSTGCRCWSSMFSDAQTHRRSGEKSKVKLIGGKVKPSPAKVTANVAEVPHIYSKIILETKDKAGTDPLYSASLFIVFVVMLMVLQFSKNPYYLYISLLTDP